MHARVCVCIYVEMQEHIQSEAGFGPQWQRLFDEAGSEYCGLLLLSFVRPSPSTAASAASAVSSFILGAYRPVPTTALSRCHCESYRTVISCPRLTKSACIRHIAYTRAHIYIHTDMCRHTHAQHTHFLCGLADEMLIASGVTVHLVLPVAAWTCFAPSQENDDDDHFACLDQCEDANDDPCVSQAPKIVRAGEELMHDCQQCVYTGSLSDAQLVAQRMQHLALQQVCVFVCVFVC